MPHCFYCHRKDGTHTPGCKKKDAVCKLCAKGFRCQFHPGKGKPGPKGRRQRIARQLTPGPGRAEFLDSIKAAISEADSTAAALRKALEILER